MFRIVGVITARMQSQRLPGKALRLLAAKTSLYHHIQRLKNVHGLSGMYLATSKSPENEPLIAEAIRGGLKIYAGEEEDVVERYLSIGKKDSAAALLRIGCDKPLFSIEMANELVRSYAGEDNLTIANNIGLGVGCEIVSTRALEYVHQHYFGPAITIYIRENIHKFKTRRVQVEKSLCRPEYRLALDTSEDYEMLSIIYDNFYHGEPIPLKEVYLLLDDNPQIANINKGSQEKNVNIYAKELQNNPVFSVYRLNSGKFIIRDCAGKSISYDEFMKIAEKKDEWLLYNEQK